MNGKAIWLTGSLLMVFSLAGCHAVMGWDESEHKPSASGGSGGMGQDASVGGSGGSAGQGGSGGSAGQGGSAGAGGEGGSSGGSAGQGGAAGSAGIGGQGGTAGSAGAAGSGGTAGQGGAAGAGGQGGAAGAAGQGGAAGSAGAGGTAGQGGAAGVGGQGGSGGSGGSAGQGGSAGVGGSGGSAGQGGSAGAGGSGGGCTDGTYRCFGSELQKCGSNTWTTESTCSGATPVCSSSQGKCLVCLPNTAQCDSATLEICNSDGSAFASSENCGSAWKCDATTKTCLGATTGNVAEIALHAYGGCARLTDGHVKCWGDNYQHVVNPNPQSGDPRYYWSAVTVLPADLADVRGIAAGPLHACAIVGDSQTVKCWGSNAIPALGKLVDGNSHVGVPEGLQDIVQLSLSYWVSCARNSKGEGWCWGKNELCGSGTAAGATSTPQKLPLTGIVDISAGYSNVCAVTADRNLYCWNKDHLIPHHVGITKQCDDVELNYLGADNYVYIRIGPSVWVTSNAYAPSTQLSLVSNVQSPTSFQATESGLCWTTQSGSGRCMNEYFGSSQIRQILGYGNSTSTSTGFGCARTTENTAICWGSDKAAQIGNTRPLIVPTATPVANLSQVTQLLSFPNWSIPGSYLAILDDGSYLAWGKDSTLWPNDDPPLRSTPTHVTLLGDANTFISGNSRGIYAGRANGMVLFDYQGEHYNTRLANTSGETYNSAFPFYNYDIGQLADGTVVVYCTNLSNCNTNGILGNGTTDVPTSPKHTVPGTQGAVGMFADGSRACVWFSDGSAKCWGRNNNGATGTGSTDPNILTPTSLALPNATIKVKKIVLGCALAASGSVYCWGDNTYGQLGRMSTGGSSPSADVVVDVTGATDLSSIGSSRCAVLSTGHVKCWGANDNGQLGLGDYQERSTPTEASGITDAIAVEASGYSFCALRQNGGVSCWGRGTSGELGNNKVFYDTPQLVQGL